MVNGQAELLRNEKNKVQAWRETLCVYYMHNITLNESQEKENLFGKLRHSPYDWNFHFAFLKEREKNVNIDQWLHASYINCAGLSNDGNISSQQIHLLFFLMSIAAHCHPSGFVLFFWWRDLWVEWKMMGTKAPELSLIQMIDSVSAIWLRKSLLIYFFLIILPEKKKRQYLKFPSAFFIITDFITQVKE